MEAKVTVGGVFDITVRDAQGNIKTQERVHNLVPTTGLNYLLNAAFSQASQASAFYIGLLNNLTINASTNMAAVAAAEITAYDEAARLEYVENAASTAGSISNSSSPAVFTCSADSTAVYGAFLSSVSTKSGDTGTLLCAAMFSSVKNLDDGDELSVVYTFGAADDGV